MPRKSRTRGRATLKSRSRNSYILSPRRVTFTPTVSPSRTLKLATLLRALQVMGFWPVMVAMSLQIASISLALFLLSPQPTLTMTLSSLGICMTLL